MLSWEERQVVMCKPISPWHKYKQGGGGGGPGGCRGKMEDNFYTEEPSSLTYLGEEMINFSLVLQQERVYCVSVELFGSLHVINNSVVDTLVMCEMGKAAFGRQKWVANYLGYYG